MKKIVRTEKYHSPILQDWYKEIYPKLDNKILASGKYKDGDEITFEDLKTFF